MRKWHSTPAAGRRRRSRRQEDRASAAESSEFRPLTVANALNSGEFSYRPEFSQVGFSPPSQVAHFSSIVSPQQLLGDDRHSVHSIQILQTLRLKHGSRRHEAASSDRSRLVAGHCRGRPGDVRADDQISIYGGSAQTYSSNVRVIAPSALTDLTVEHVDWRTDAFSNPLYYGFRLHALFRRVGPSWASRST